jgi:hypothetical protein
VICDDVAPRALACQIRGALEGVDSSPPRWLEQLELREVVESVAEDLCNACHVREALDEDGCFDLERYPGW